jgi:hypothetical protein
MFRKPSLADLYLHELRSKLDGTLVPLFPPTARVQVGSIGRFDEGRFDVVGHLRELTRQSVPTSTAHEADWVFVSEGRARLVPSGRISNPLGGDLLGGKLSLTGGRAVVVSLKGVETTTTRSLNKFDELLWKLYLDGSLHQDDVVVWSVQCASSGTVLINRTGDVELELTVDPALVGGLLSFQGLGAGVTFGAGDQASFQLSGASLTPFIRTKGLDRNDVARVVSVRGFQGSVDDGAAAFAGASVPELTIDHVLADVDFAE